MWKEIWHLKKERVEAINRSNQYLRLIDEAVDLMRRYHPQGERYYWSALL
ncbi:MAG: hypothetical protein ACLU9T_17425 [Blautia faecis]